MAGAIASAGDVGDPVVARDGVLVTISGSIPAGHSPFSPPGDAGRDVGSGWIRFSAAVRAGSRTDAAAGRITSEPGESQAAANSVGAERETGLAGPTCLRSGTRD